MFYISLSWPRSTSTTKAASDSAVPFLITGKTTDLIDRSSREVKDWQGRQIFEQLAKVGKPSRFTPVPEEVKRDALRTLSGTSFPNERRSVFVS